MVAVILKLLYVRHHILFCRACLSGNESTLFCFHFALPNIFGRIIWSLVEYLRLDNRPGWLGHIFYMASCHLSFITARLDHDHFEIYLIWIFVYYSHGAVQCCDSIHQRISF